MNRLIYICLLCSGMGKAARGALQSELAEMQQREEFPCAVTTKLNKAIVQDFMPHARGRQTWAKKASWMRKFHVFSQQICDKSGVRRSAEQCLRSEVMCRHFIAHVATENKGPTRPRSARMVLSAERAKRGWTSLSENPTISAIVEGAEAAQPLTKKQSAGITRTMVKLIVDKYGKAVSWWKRQTALMIALGFLSLMRSGKLCTIKRSGVRFVFVDGSESLAMKLKHMPKPTTLKGVLLHLPWRKNHRDMDCWVPVSCVHTLTMLLQHITFLRSQRTKSVYLFLSQQGKNSTNQYNHVRQNKFVVAMQWALRECVPGMNAKWAKQYTGHALRVGGSNEMRRIGVADEVHRKLGGWMTMTAAQGYMSLSAQERLRLTLKLTKRKSRESGFQKEAAVDALGTVLNV